MELQPDSDWMRECFPDARLCDVEELVKLFERGEVESHGRGFAPGRYVGATTPEEGREGHDFEEALRAVSIDTEMPNKDPVALAAPIARNSEELGT